MKYRYSVVSGQTNVDGSYTKRPVVEVELSRGNHRRKFLALIDSGADQIMMPAAIAEAFDIDREKCPRRTSLGVSMEPVEGFISHLTFRIAEQADAFPVLLGREGFFDNYRIKFEQDHDTFEIAASPRS